MLRKSVSGLGRCNSFASFYFEYLLGETNFSEYFQGFTQNYLKLSASKRDL